MQFELTKELLDQLRAAILEKDTEYILAAFDEFYPADIAAILYEFDTEQSIYIIQLLSEDEAAEVISFIDADTRKEFLKNFQSEKIATYLKNIDSDDAVDIVNELPIKEREEVIAYLEHINKEQASYILELLRYEEDCAGGLMAKELIKAYSHWNIKQCIEEIRHQTENVERFYSIYVVDEDEKLIGLLALKKLILANDHTLVKDIYDEDLICIESYKSSEDVVELMQKYDLEAIPVVNVQGKLVGRITIDDVVDVITQQAEEDREAMTGISESVEEDDSVWILSRARLPWLIIGMLGGLMGSRFIGLFEANLALVPAMAFFIPLITATGGNVGVQSSSIVVQSLANKSFLQENILKRLFKVLIVGLLNGFVLALLVYIFNLLIGEGNKLASVVSFSLLSVVLLSSIMGTITPMVLNRFGVNPALASGPFITTTNDLLGLAVYFTIANFFLLP